VAKFSTYSTYYDIYCEAAPKGGRKTYREYYVDAIKRILGALEDPNSLKKVYQDPETFKTALECKEDWPLSLSTHEAEYTWYSTGRPTFKIFPGMVDALAHTSIEVECEHIHLPFPSFRIELPVSNRLGEAHGEPGYDGLLVTTDDIVKFDALEGGQGVKLCVFASRRGREKHYEPLSLKLYNRICAAHGTLPLMNHHSLLGLPIISEQMTVKELLVKYDEQMTQHEESFGSRMARRNLLGLVIATILIATSDDKRLIKPEERGLKHRLKAQRARKRGDKSAGREDIGFCVGADIKLPKELSKAINQPAGGEGRSLNYGHIRSGHLRVQPYGKKGEDKRYKVIFLAPALVRPDLPMKPKLTDRAIK
jgi:hypothetical protein